MILDQLLNGPQYARPQADKEALLLPELVALTRYHVAQCPAYRQIVEQTASHFEQAATLAGLPYLPVGLFKSHRLQSVTDAAIRVTLTSSGTTGQAVSRIAVDDATAKLQARGLIAIMREAIGDKRLPLLIIDSAASVAAGNALSARGAGVLGLMLFGQAPVFALNDDMSVRMDAVTGFLQRHGDKPFLIFGFTFMVWRYFQQALLHMGLDCGQGVLIHSGGWKKLADAAVDNRTLRAGLKQAFNLERIHNFYGMVEQTGTAWLEGVDGLLYPPAFGDVLIRDPQNWQVLPAGQPGIIQVLSLLPHSYPGHSLLTEDRGVIETVDAGAGGRQGKAVRVLGRAAKAELRGCSDVHAYGSAA